jgi:hypothetical protein
MAYEEVAEVLDVSVGTVKSRILRGRRLLRDILEPVLGSAPLAQHPAPLANRTSSQQAHGMEGRPASKTVLHSPLFSPVKEKISTQRDTAGWTAPGKPGNAEGGV